MIELKDVTKVYCKEEVETPALRGVSFSIKAGEFVAIMGPSGSGKSTLMHIMSFLDRPTEGTYMFDGKSMSDLDDDGLARTRNKRMGFVFQSFNLLPRTNVLENVRLPLIYTRIEPETEQRMVLGAIEAVGLSHRLDHTSNQLSGGEKQRVAIARAIVNKPAVIFADEPTGNLDSKTSNEVMKILQDLNEQGHTIVLVTHERYTSEHAQRIIYLKDGRIDTDREVSQRVFARSREGLTK